MNVEEIISKIDMAKRQIEDIKTARSQYQDALKKLELNEAGWHGYIEALMPYSVVEEAPKLSKRPPKSKSA